jgi:hypothetical protein
MMQIRASNFAATTIAKSAWFLGTFGSPLSVQRVKASTELARARLMSKMSNLLRAVQSM